MLNRIYKKIIRTYYSLTGNEEKVLEMKIERFVKEGGRCGSNFKFYCDMPGEPFLVEIGNDVTISYDTALLTHDNAVIKCDLDATDYFGKIRIGDRCFIGAKSILLPGVVLGNNTIVGAGSVVTKSFPDGNLVIAGNPAKEICTVEQFRSKKKGICVNLDKEGLRAKKREYLMSLSEEMFERK